jgi:hypothetical protein
MNRSIRPLCASVLLTLASDAGAAELVKKTQLYVGTQGNCNASVVATNDRHLRCAIRPVGHTIAAATALPPSDFVEVFAGTTAGVNEGVVTADKHYAGGSTSSIGYLSRKHLPGSKRLFVGSGACNNGVVTDNRRHLGCETKDLGYAIPE